GANLSESEAELDGDHNITELPQVYAGRGNLATQQSAIRLTEIGPRMSLELVKIEEGMCDGDVIYHSFVQKTEEEIQEALRQREKRQKLKEDRRKKQESNIRRKQEEREMHKKNSLAGMTRKQVQHDDAEGDNEVEDPCTEEKVQSDQSDADLDREYYRLEVGVEPDDDLFPATSYRKRKRDRSPTSGRKPKRTKGPDRATGKKPSCPDSDRSNKKIMQKRKTRLVGTHLVNSPFNGEALGSKALFKRKWRRDLGSKAKGQRPSSQAKGQRPSSQAKGQRPSSKGKGQHPSSKGKGQHPSSQAKGQRPSSQAKGQRPSSQAKGQHPSSKGKGQHPSSKGKGQHPSSKGKGQSQKRRKIKRYFKHK
ncbi:hypothetical protein scyTo_0020665, partial [Scyliorhinus torazame]|nr:hypothetical protein [Scyliorhinus torazame]